MAEDESNDPVALAFVIMAEVMDHFKQNTTSGQGSTGMNLVNPDALFQEAENLLENGKSVQEVTQKLKDQTHKKLGMNICSPVTDQTIYDPTKNGMHEQKEVSVANNSTKNKMKLNDGASCSTKTLNGCSKQFYDDDEMKRPLKRLLTNSDEEMEHSVEKLSSSSLNQGQAKISSKECNTNAAVPSSSALDTAPLHGRIRVRKDVTEVTIDSDDESSGSVECLNTRPSSSASDVLVVEGQDDTFNLPGNFTAKVDDVMIVTEGEENSVNEVSKQCDSAVIIPIAGTSQNDDPIGSPKDEINQEIVHEEALEISRLLPSFELPVIEDVIRVHYMLPNRKYTILSSFIASARVEGCKVPDAAFAMLRKLRKGKRSREDNILDDAPRKKRLTSDLRETSGSSSHTNDEYRKGPLSIPESEVTSSQSGGHPTPLANNSSHKGKRAKLSANSLTLSTTIKVSTSSATSNAFNEGASTSSHNSSVLVATSPVPLDQLHKDTEPSVGSASTSGMFVPTAPVPLEDVESSNDVTGFSITIDSRPVAPPAPRPWEPPHPFQWPPSSPPKKNTWATDVPKSPRPNEGNWRHLEPPPTPPTSDDEEDNWPVVHYERAPQYEFGGLPVTGLSSEARKNWLQDKIALISSIVGNVPLATITERVKYCTTDEDIERVTDVLLTESLTKEGSSNQKPNQNLLNEPQAGPSGLQARVASRPESEESASSSTDRHLVDTSPGPSTSTADNVSSSVVGTAQDAAGHGNDEENEGEEWIESHSKTLWDMFPDADPEHLSKKCLQLNYDQAAFGELVLELMENKSYPKMEEYINRKKRREMRKKFIDGMSVPEFLELFEEPEKVFFDTTKEMSAQYRQNSRAQLLLDLPYFLSKDVDQVLAENNYHYLPSLRKLQDGKVYGRRKTKRKDVSHSGELEDFFLKELCYARLRDPIAKYRCDQARARQKAFDFAKMQNLLCECPICCEDEVLEEDMRHCEAAVSHGFCKNCVKRYSEEQIGQGSLLFRCLEGECQAEFSLSVLKSVLKSSVFSSLLKRKQAQEIMAAGITDLENCPFCDFATIMPNQENKVFNCLNPECLKDSCRLCKQQSHIPLRCEEVETQTQLSARTYLENQMSEAMVRECYNCGKRFIKEDGCNKMVCSCRAVMCYLCKKPIKGYDHFSDNARGGTSTGKCPLWSNSLKLHAEEVQQRAEEAKKTLDPDVQLKHDPTKDLPQIPEFLQGQPTHQAPRPFLHHRQPPQPPRHHAGAIRMLAPPREGDFIFADLINQLEDAEYVVRRLNQQEWRHQELRLPMAHALYVPRLHDVGAGGLPAAPAAAAAAAGGGNWLQVQVNLDNRNMEHPRVEVQAGGAGNNQWQIQYNVLNQNRQQQLPPIVPPRAVPGIVQPIHQQPIIGHQYQPPQPAPLLAPPPPPPAHRHELLRPELLPMEARIPPPPAHRPVWNPLRNRPLRRAGPFDYWDGADGERWLGEVLAEMEPRDRLEVFGDALRPVDVGGGPAAPVDGAVLPEQREEERRQAEGRPRHPHRPRRH